MFVLASKFAELLGVSPGVFIAIAAPVLAGVLVLLELFVGT